MHDPMTVAFEIRRPWGDKPSQFWPKGYRPSWITIWHVDPEADGSDDSCGFSFPKVPEGTEWVKKLQGDLDFLCREDPQALRRQRQREGDPAWWICWLMRASFWHRGKPLSADLVAAELYSHSYPGNREEHFTDRDTARQAWIFARCYLQLVRPWWRHPRWHVWHWKIQIHPLQDFKRWAFSRCIHCGGRFKFGASVCGSWGSTGPRWFRNEQAWHCACEPSSKAQMSEVRSDAH